MEGKLVSQSVTCFTCTLDDAECSIAPPCLLLLLLLVLFFAVLLLLLLLMETNGRHGFPLLLLVNLGKQQSQRSRRLAQFQSRSFRQVQITRAFEGLVPNRCANF